MDGTTDRGTLLNGVISADSIEDALAESWRKVRSTDDADHPAARASVLTLMVYVVDPARASTIFEALRGLTDKHPSRAIVLLPDLRTAADNLRVWHSTGCTDSIEGERYVCTEQIVVEAIGHAVRYLPSLTDQLTLPDLPSFLWWAGDLLPADDFLFEQLTGFADRLIVDSCDFGVLGSSSARVHRLTHRHQSPCLVSDLTWARLTPWRELTAQFFDAPAIRARLPDVDGVTIDYDPSTSEPGWTEALLLLSWLGSRLGWELDGSTVVRPGTGFSSRLRRPGGAYVNFTLRPTPEARLPGLRQVTLTVGDTITLLAAREDDGMHTRTEIDQAGVPILRRMARFESLDLSSLLAEELTLFQRDQVYEEALGMLVGFTTIAGRQSWQGR